MPVDIAVIVMETAQTVLPITDIVMAGGIMVTAISMVVSAAATAAHLVDVIEIKFCKIPCDSKQVKTYSIPISPDIKEDRYERTNQARAR